MIGCFVPFTQAWDAITNNEARSYPVSKRNGTSGFERIHGSDIPDVRHTPKFTLPRDAAYFTIGSCFARNVERALISRGMRVLNTECQIPGELYSVRGPDNRNSALNAYNPHSMRDLLTYADRQDWRTIGALQVDEAGDGWADMLMSGLRFMSSEELFTARTQLRNTYLLLPQADVFIMTLGYTESWYDNKSDIFTNRSPAGARQIQRHGNQFSFFNADAASVIEAVNTAIEIVRTKTDGRVKTVLTVSPVPLSGTYSGMDVVSANIYSKATLVTAARQVSSQNNDVDYFPSYEIVSLARPEVAWKADGAHVQPALVDAVIGRFTDMYIK